MADIAIKEKVKTIRDLLNASKDQLALALPRHLNPDRLLRIAMTTIQRNPKLLECDPRTLVGAILQCAQLGLEPDNILGHAYLVPFFNSKLHRTDVTLIPGYKGLIELARRSKEIQFIKANVVYEGDEWEYQEEPPKLRHVPCPAEMRGALKKAYAIIVFKNGHREAFVVDRVEVEKAKARSKAKDSGPWVTDEEAMWKKTAIRRLAPYLPQCPEFQKAEALETISEINHSQQEFFFDEKDIIEAEAKEMTEKAISNTEALKKKLEAQKTKPQSSHTCDKPEEAHPPEASDLLIPEKQLTRFHAICTERKIPAETYKRYLKNFYGIESSKDIQKDWYDDIIRWAERWQDISDNAAM